MMEKICLNVPFAVRYGVKEAIVLQFFDDALSSPCRTEFLNAGGGQWWVKVAYAEIGRALPFLNASTVRKLVPKLCEIGALQRIDKGKDFFYRVDNVFLNEMLKSRSAEIL